MNTGPAGRVLGYIMSGQSQLTSYLTLKQFCQHTRLSVSTVRRRVKDGTIPVLQLGGRRKKLWFAPDALKQVCGESRTQPQQPIVDPIPALPGPSPRWRKKVRPGRN